MELLIDVGSIRGQYEVVMYKLLHESGNTCSSEL